MVWRASDAPNAIRDTCSHCQGDAETLMCTAEVVVHETVPLPTDLFWAREPSLTLPGISDTSGWPET
jgi:hypothetical protein